MGNAAQHDALSNCTKCGKEDIAFLEALQGIAIGPLRKIR